MDEFTSSVSNQPVIQRAPLGMSSFGLKERQEFGQNVRLAMACIAGTEAPVTGKALPSDVPSIRQRLHALSGEMTSQHADLLELLVRFDDMKGWESGGAKHCAAWMNLEIGIGLKLGWEYLRVGRKLRSLPTTTALFRAGKISWSKIRVIVDVADADNEKILCHAALDASVTEVVRLCKDYRWANSGSDNDENTRVMQQWESRSLSWCETSAGNTHIRLTLPPDMAQVFLNSVEHSLNQLDNSDSSSDSSISQRRADAAVNMAEASLQSAGREIATADRYQVIVSVDSTELSNSAVSPKSPPKRALINGAGPIARETARRIACDCSLTHHILTEGEPTSIGRKSRLWPTAIARAIKNRDQHCQFNGCTQTRNLQIHHIKHWADGGSTSVDNGVCLCQSCHTKVHEGGYSIQKVDGNDLRLEAQFSQQCFTHQEDQINIESELRNDRQSFNRVRKLSPTRYRFRVVDSNGIDIRDASESMHSESMHSESTRVESTRRESTRVDYSSPRTDNPWNINELPPSRYVRYLMNHSELSEGNHDAWIN